MNLRISQHVAHSLQIDYHQVALSHLPREVTEALSDHTLLGILLNPPCVVVVLVVFALDEVLAVVVLEWSVLIKYFVDV